ncbi:MAG: hypothetical protein HZA30_03310, partial [Candidatus Omnitrophica bacterium]|nr:hypothetical protein [Candidatus Omnitrophota bacterium]
MKSLTDVNSLLSENAKKVLEKRYLKKDGSGNPVETAEDMFRRVAKNIATADSYYGKGEGEVR